MLCPHTTHIYDLSDDLVTARMLDGHTWYMVADKTWTCIELGRCEVVTHQMLDCRLERLSGKAVTFLTDIARLALWRREALDPSDRLEVWEQIHSLVLVFIRNNWRQRSPGPTPVPLLLNYNTKFFFVHGHLKALFKRCRRSIGFLGLVQFLGCLVGYLAEVARLFGVDEFQVTILFATLSEY